jgi:hypothetical protein
MQDEADRADAKSPQEAAQIDIIIGAGLAVGACLRRAGVPFVRPARTRCEADRGGAEPGEYHPRDLLGLPIPAIVIPLSVLPGRVADALAVLILRLLFGDPRRLGLRKLPYVPFMRVASRARVPPSNVGTLKPIERGEVAVRGGALHGDRRGVSCL